MKKWLMALIVIGCVVFITVFADTIYFGIKEDANTEETVLLVPSTHNMSLNGQEINPNNPAGYNIEGRNYYRLRDIAEILKTTSAKFSVNYNVTEQAVYIETEKDYTSVGGELAGAAEYGTDVKGSVSKDKIYINGVPSNVKAYKINGNNYYELRDLSEKLGFFVEWDAQTMTVLIKTTKWEFPMRNATTSKPFAKKHLAMDILPGQDTTIYAAADGVVASVGLNGTSQDAATIKNPKGNGYFIIIEHNLNGKKVYSFYAHLKEGSFKVNVNDSVKAGQPIAVCGNTGNSTATHLHFTVTDKLLPKGGYYGYTRDGIAISGNSYFDDVSGVTFYNADYIIQNQKLPEI